MKISVARLGRWSVAISERGLAPRPPFAMLLSSNRYDDETQTTEDWLSMAQRHVAEGEAHVARQETLIAGLDRDGHTELAAEARALLTTLETSLRLMRADLSRIENEPRRSGPE